MGSSALTRVFAFTILANDDPVEVASGGVAKRTLGAFEDLCRSHIGVLLERLTDGQTQAPERDVIRYI